MTVKADNDKLSGDANENLVGYTVSGWTLDNTNKSTYLVRNVAPENLATAQPAWWQYNNAESNYYRFVDVAAVETGVSLYRTHFGIDPNYAVDNVYATGSLLNKVAQTIPAGDLTPAGETPPLLSGEYFRRETHDGTEHYPRDRGSHIGNRRG